MKRTKIKSPNPSMSQPSRSDPQPQTAFLTSRSAPTPVVVERLRNNLMTTIIVVTVALLAAPALAQLSAGEMNPHDLHQQQLQMHQEILVQPNARVRIECKLPQLASNNQRLYYWNFQRASTHTKSQVLCFENKCLDEPTLGYHLEMDRDAGAYDLWIQNATYELNDGLYTCFYKDMSPESPQTISRDFRLTVLIPPQAPVIVPVSAAPAREGQEYQLSCQVQGANPEPNITWFRNDQPLVSGSSVRIEQTHGNGSTASTLSWLPTIEDHQSTYKCLVWNKAMSSMGAYERELKLQVEYAPRISVGPYNPLKVLQNQPITLQCQVDANPAVKGIRWFRDGHLLSNQFNLTLAKADLSDSALYTCQADNGIPPLTSVALMQLQQRAQLQAVSSPSNGANQLSHPISPTATEAQLQVQVLYGPRVQVRANKATAASEGDFVSLNCSVDSWPAPYEIVWTRNDDPSFRRLSTSLLEFQPVAASDMANYTCTAFNRLDPSGHQHLVERQGSSSAQLQVRHKPGLAEIQLGQAGETELGAKTLIQCRARPAGFPEPQYKFWKFQGPQSNQKLHLNKQAHGPSYTIYSAKADDEARYGCLASNELGASTEADGELIVNEPPSIIHDVSTRRDQDARPVGQTGYSITVRASAKPKPRLTWIHRSPVDGRRIELGGADTEHKFEVKTQADLEPGSRAKYNVISTLIFKQPLEVDDRGLYSVEISNGLSRSAVEDFQLHVNHAPIPAPRGLPVRSGLANQAAAQGQSAARTKAGFDLGETVNLTCRVSAYPRPDFVWYSSSASADSDKPIDSNPRFRLLLSNPRDDIWESTLTFSQAQESDYGDYMCVSANHDQQSDRMSDSVQIIVTLGHKTSPDPPGQVEAIESSQDSITLQWQAGFDGGFVQNHFLVQYAPDDGSGHSLSRRFPHSDSLSAFLSAGASADNQLQLDNQAPWPRLYDCLSINPCTINQLQSRQTYLFRLRAKNELGFSELSDELRASTRANLSQTPHILEATYDQAANMLRIQLEPGSEYLLSNVNARIDIRSTSGSTNQPQAQATGTGDSSNQLEAASAEWRLLTRVTLRQERDQAQVHVQPDREQLRLSLCSRQNDSLCGPEFLVNMKGSHQDVRIISASLLVSSLALVVILVGLVTSLHSCCLSRRKAKKLAASAVGVTGAGEASLDNKPGQNGVSAGSHAGSTTSTNSTSVAQHSAANGLIEGQVNGANSDHSSDHSRQAKLDSMLPPNYNHYADRASIMLEQQQQQQHHHQQQLQMLAANQQPDKLNSLFGHLTNGSLIASQAQQSPMTPANQHQFTYGQIEQQHQQQLEPNSMLLLNQSALYDQTTDQNQLWPQSQHQSLHDDYSYNTLAAYSAPTNQMAPAPDQSQLMEPAYGTSSGPTSIMAFETSSQFQPYAFHHPTQNQHYQQELAAAQQQMYGTLTRNGYQQQQQQIDQQQQHLQENGLNDAAMLNAQQSHYGTLLGVGANQMQSHAVLGPPPPPPPPQESDYEATGQRNANRLIREIIV